MAVSDTLNFTNSYKKLSVILTMRPAHSKYCKGTEFMTTIEAVDLS